MNILIVEDDDSVGRFLQRALSEAGYNAMLVGDGLDALDTARSTQFDLILLDLMIPRLNGLEVCRKLRASLVMTPILIISSRDSLQDKIDGLDGGADDYMAKPFRIGELLARSRALLRRGTSGPSVFSIDNLTLDPATRQARRAGKTVNLSATEYALLEYLMRNSGQVLTRSMILEHVWEYDFDGNDNVLDVYISYLRKKIDSGSSNPLIHTVRGVGYRVGTANAN